MKHTSTDINLVSTVLWKFHASLSYEKARLANDSRILTRG